jgi:hypothetical protein
MGGKVRSFVSCSERLLPGKIIFPNKRISFPPIICLFPNDYSLMNIVANLAAQVNVQSEPKTLYGDVLTVFFVRLAW